MATERMYDLAFQYKKNKLWKKLYDTDIFAVRFADGTIGYCCVMGMIGECNAVALYPDAKAFQSYRKISGLSPVQFRSESDYQEFLISMDCLQCAFDSKDSLSDDDLKEVRAYTKKHGITLRGPNAFPQFVSYRPYHYPWSVTHTADQQRICEALEACNALSELLENRHKSEIGLDDRMIRASGQILLLEKNGDSYAVARTEIPPELPESHPSPAVPNDLTAARIKRMKKHGTLECEVIRMPEPVQTDPDQVPYYPVVLMGVDRDSGYLYPLKPVVDFEEHPEALLDAFAQSILEVDGCPKSIVVNDDRTYALLQNLCAAVGIKLVLTDEDLDSLEEAKDGLFAAMSPMVPFDDEYDELENPELALFEDMIESLMMLSDSELREMPKELAHQMLQLADEGILPDEVAWKLQRVLGR